MTWFRKRRPIEHKAGLAASPQVAFMHLPKTGGTSVLAALRERLPADAVETIAYGVADDPDNLDLVALRTKALLHGHFSARWVGLFDRATLIAVCLRDPLETTRSFYKYFLAHKPTELSGRQAYLRKVAEKGFKHYLQQWRIERSSQYYIHFLDPLYFFPPGMGAVALTGAHLEKSIARALRFLDRCDMVGTSDDLSGFTGAILTALGHDSTGLVVERRNVSVELAKESPDRFLDVPAFEEDDEEIRQLLVEVNQPAMRIYQHALDLKGAA
jgi:hypothetical protein